jgi:rhodanese-related sulfurtransferase
MNTITATQLKRMMDGDESFDLVNVLPEEDFQKQHIPGSINLPVKNHDFVSQVQQRVGGDKEREIVVYCASKQCDASSTAARNLERAGFTNIEAGMQGWKEAGHPVDTGAVRA